MDCVSKCLVELRAKREQLEQAIMALERFGTGTGRRRGRPPEWLRVAQTVAEPAEVRPKAAPRKARKRKMTAEGKLAIRTGVALRHWKVANPDASDDDIAKQRDRIRQQLQRNA